MTSDLSRRQLFTEALPRGLGDLLRGVLHARQELGEWAAAGAAPLTRWAAPNFDLVASLRELDQQLRLEHPEWFPDDMPDPRDSKALLRWIDERQKERRNELRERLTSPPLEARRDRQEEAGQ